MKKYKKIILYGLILFLSSYMISSIAVNYMIAHKMWIYKAVYQKAGQKF